ncbi:hypothetical protein PCE1_001641 [Barthelona sp. PCE]
MSSESDFDCFASDSQGSEWERQLEERARLAQEKIDEKNAAKDTTAFSNVGMQVLPEAEIPIEEVVEAAKEIVAACPGVVEITGEQVQPFVFGLKKLILVFKIQDEEASTDDIVDALVAHEKISSAEITSFNKA